MGWSIGKYGLELEFEMYSDSQQIDLARKPCFHVEPLCFAFARWQHFSILSAGAYSNQKMHRNIVT